MAKLQWHKARAYEQDPGAIVSPPDDLKPDRWIPPQEAARQKAIRAKARQELLERSELRRCKHILKKYSASEALALGVPKEMIEKREAGRRANEKARLKRHLGLKPPA